MKLSKLLYQCVKSATDLGDPSFTYLSLIKGEALNNPDYSSSIDKAILNINAFLQRLSALDKLPCAMKDFVVSDSKEIDLSVCSPKCKRVVAVFQFLDVEETKWVNYDYRSLNRGKIKVLGTPMKDRPIYVQYRVEVPNFDESDIPFITDYDETNLAEKLAEAIENDIDLLETYGVPETAIPLCCSYVKALQNDTDSSLMHALMVETEARILDIELDEHIFYPNGVVRVCL